MPEQTPAQLDSCGSGIALLTSEQLGLMLAESNSGEGDNRFAHFPYNYARLVEAAVRAQFAACSCRAAGARPGNKVVD
jgi:hypothetical protein